MDIFNAMMQFNVDKKSAMESFYKAYELAARNGLVMPFVEYGRQLLPLTEYVLENDSAKNFSEEWLLQIMGMAQAYEAHLQEFRRE